MFDALRAVSLAILCLALFATTAAAECAWMLWRFVTPPTPQDWTPVAAFNSKVECEKARSKDPLVGEFCLPDTVDPRGPKGKVK